YFYFFVFLLLIHTTPISTLFPYTTLFRSSLNVNSLYPFLPVEKAYQLIEELLPIYQINSRLERLPRIALWLRLLRPSWFFVIARSEEHTSELQSRENLVCRLLLEKKK